LSVRVPVLAAWSWGCTFPHLVRNEFQQIGKINTNLMFSKFNVNSTFGIIGHCDLAGILFPFIFDFFIYNKLCHRCASFCFELPVISCTNRTITTVGITASTRSNNANGSNNEYPFIAAPPTLVPLGLCSFDRLGQVAFFLE